MNSMPDDLETLYRGLYAVASHYLQKYHKMYLIGATLINNQFQLITCDTDINASPEENIIRLERYFRKRLESEVIKCAGFCVGVEIDISNGLYIYKALSFSLESISGLAFAVHVPYSISPSNKYIFKERGIAEKKPRIYF
jgi:hypothetical protein